MTSRREPIRRRLIARLQKEDAPTVLDADVDEDAAELLKAETHAVLSGEPDAPAYCMEAFVILGWLFWKRYLRKKIEDERSLNLALVLFAPVATANPSVAPDVVPEGLLGELLRRSRSDEPPVGVWINMVGEIVTRLGDRTALLAGAAVLAMGLGMSPPGSENRWRCQDNLVYVLSSLYEAYGDSEALAEAVALARSFAADTTPGTGMHTRSVQRLTETLHFVYSATGDHVVLTEAVENARDAVRGCPPGHEELVELTNILAGSLTFRHSVTGDTSSLGEATDMLRGLLDELPADHPAYATSMAQLAIVLGRQHGVDSDPAQADEIAGLCRSALDGIPPGDPIRPLVLAALTDILVFRARRTGAAEDLDEALSSARRAVAEVPPGKRLRGQALQALAVALAARHERFDDIAAFGEAVALLQQGTSEAVNEVERADLRFNLAALWNNRYAATRDPEHARAAVAALQAAATSSGCSARRQVRAAVAAAEILGELGEWSAAAGQLGTAVELLSTLAGRHLPFGDRRSALSEFKTAPVRAASYAIAAGRPDRAVELLECGRGLLFAENAAFRNGVGELASRAPELASALTRVLTDLDVASNADSRHQLDRDRQRLIDQVRELDGFEDFLKPQRISEIVDACRSGPVVLPLAARERLDALIVTTDGVRHVPLPRETLETFSAHMRRLIEGVGIATDPRSVADLRRGEKLVQLGLDWLWDAITGPILDALGLCGAAPDGGTLPRVWWCPTGVLSYLPLHAAGRAGGPQALDHAVFSYTTSLRTLSRTPPWRPRKDSGPLVVGLSRTPGLADLPAVEQELAILAGTFPQCRILRNASATRAKITAALPDHDIVHFTCHGGDNPENHYEGQLFLHDGALTFPDIAATRVDRAKLAFLSACTTARSGLALPDEALSIATGFQLAGFSDVVATLWPIADQTAFQVASDFYTDLTADAGSSVAYALRRAVHKLRAREPDRPSLWAPYIHLGA